MPDRKLSAKETADLCREYTFFSWSVQSKVNPIPVSRAEGVYFWDMDGKRYLDFSSQLMNTNIGHQHPKVVKAIQEQAAELCFVSRACHRTARPLGKRLAEVTPGNLRKTFFTLGRANENDCSPAYTGGTRFGALPPYFMVTHGAIALTGDTAAMRWNMPCREGHFLIHLLLRPPAET
jgi:taurine--2-oxoglutarate transaminase